MKDFFKNIYLLAFWFIVAFVAFLMKACVALVS